MKKAFIVALVAALAVPALAVPVNFTEDYSSYSNGARLLGGPWQRLNTGTFNIADPGLVATTSYTISGTSYLVGNSGFSGVDKGDFAMLVPAGEEVTAPAGSSLTLQYDAKAGTAKNADFYVELSLGDVRAPRLADLGVGVALPAPIPVVAYCKPVLNPASPAKAMYFFDGSQWKSTGSLDTNGAIETISMILEGGNATVDTSIASAPNTFTLAYTGGFDRISTYTRDHMWTTAAVIDNLSVVGGSVVPEPATAIIMLGLSGLFLRRRR